MRGSVAEQYIESASPGLNLRAAVETADLEDERGKWNAGCRGEMQRDPAEHRWRRRHTGAILTLRYESVGIEQD